MAGSNETGLPAIGPCEKCSILLWVSTGKCYLSRFKVDLSL